MKVIAGNQKQIAVAATLIDLLKTFEVSNDIDSPTILSDFEEEVSKLRQDDTITQEELYLVTAIGYNLFKDIRYDIK